MVNLIAKDGNGALVQIKAVGAGTELDPFIVTDRLENTSGTQINPATQETLAAILGRLPTALGSQPAAGSLSVTAAASSTWAVTQSGTWTVNLGTLGGAATEATLSTLSGKVPAGLTVASTRLLVDGSGVTQPVSGPLTNTELRANPVPVSGTVSANTGLAQPLTDTQLRATPVPVSGSVSTGLVQPLTDEELRAEPVEIVGAVTANTGLAQPLTDSQIRATPLPVSGTVTANTGLAQPLTDTQIRATPLPVSGTVSTGLSQPLTDTQLRATAVPVSGTVTANTGLAQPLTDAQIRATPLPVSGTVSTGLNQPLTDTQLRAAPVPITDGGGSLTVDNGGTFPVQAAQSGTWTVQPGNTPNTTPWLTRISDGTNPVSIFNLTNSKPLATALVDASGNQITSFGGGTQYAVDSVAGGVDLGTAMLVVRRDVPSLIGPADGDYSRLFGDRRGHIWVRNKTGFTHAQTLTVLTTAYSAGQTMVALVTIPNAVDVAGEQIVLDSVVFSTRTNIIPAFNLEFFDTAVTLGAAGAAWGISADDQTKNQGSVSIVAADWVNDGTPNKAQRHNLGEVMVTSGTSLFFALKATGAVTFSATNGLWVSMKFRRQ